jgi:integrase
LTIRSTLHLFLGSRLSNDLTPPGVAWFRGYPNGHRRRSPPSPLYFAARAAEMPAPVRTTCCPIDGGNRREAGLDKSYRGFTRLHRQAAEIFNFPALRLSPLHIIYRPIAPHLWMGWRDGCGGRTIVKTKTISAALQAANAPVGVHKVAGVAGLYLKIGETGAGSYFYRYRLGDRRREIGLGSREKVSLADACKAAKAWAVLRDEGHDPIETRRRERADNLAKSRAQQPITFKQMAETYLHAHGASWKHRYAKAGWWNPLAKFAFPIIGGLGLDEIEISHITAIMLRAERAGAPDTARRVRSRIELVLNAAIAQALRTATLINPAGGKLIAAAHPSKRKGERPHYRAVKIDDAQEVFRALKAEEGSAFGAWLFMVLAAARPSAALEARWAEVDFDRRLWTLPPERMKSAKQHACRSLPPRSRCSIASRKSAPAMRCFPAGQAHRSPTPASPPRQPRLG